MFFIVNKTKSPIILNDLKITLGPRQALDLDQRFPREKSNYSKDLISCVTRGQIEIKRKDGEKKEVNVVNKEIITQNIDVDKMKDELKKEFNIGINDIKEQILKLNIPSNSISGDELTKILAQIFPNIKQSENINKEEEVEINEDVLSTIHAKAVDKLTKNVEMKKANYDEKIVTNTLDQNISELENLLG